MSIARLSIAGYSLLLSATAAMAEAPRDVAAFMVVDCLLPGQVRQLGGMQYLAARRAVQTTAGDCEIRGGEYVAHDRADMGSALRVWLPLAREGDAHAQTLVGEIHERHAATPNHALAAHWYLQAAEQGDARAAVNLGSLFERGLGVQKDAALAAYWYRKASGVDALQFEVPAEVPAGAAVEEAAAAGTPEPAPRGNIEIIEPPTTLFRGKPRFRSVRPGGRQLVIGRLTQPREVRLVLVAGQEAQMLDGSLFRASILFDRLADKVDVLVIYADGSHERMEIMVAGGADAGGGGPVAVEDLLPELATPAQQSAGRQFALLIGNTDYAYLSDLDTADDDVRELGRLLEGDYGFSVRVLENADRYSLLSAINALRKDMRETDRVLIYYAGHGELDRVNERGHWLPVDAEADNQANWISNVTLTDLLNTLPARQVTVIADSCYSGTMSRAGLGVIRSDSSAETRAALLGALSGMRTRTVLTSGGIAPVLDSGGGGHSVFARALLDVLARNRGAITGLELHRAVSVLVEDRARRLGFDQKPEYSPLRFAGHEAGDFLFSRVH